MLNTASTLEYDNIKREQVLAWLLDHVTQSRIDHILRVEQMSAQLARHHNLDAEKAAQAGLLHDLAKYFQPKKLLAMARCEGLEIDPDMESHPHLLHADVSAIIARDTFGIRDEEVLQAIANHTLGRPGMNHLSCIVFLADSLEPGRGNTPELEALRQLSDRNLHQAVWRTCDRSIKFLLESHCAIHPRTVATRNWFLNSVKNKQPSIRTTA